MKRNGLFNLVLIFSFLLTNIGITPANETITGTPKLSNLLNPIIESITTRIKMIQMANPDAEAPPGVTATLPPPGKDTPTPTATPVSGIGPTPEPTLMPTQTPTEVVKPTIAPTLKPTEIIKPTLEPTIGPVEVITQTATPTPGLELFLPSMEVSLEPDPTAPGDVVTATWMIHNYQGQWNGVEVWLYLTEAFIPLEIGNATFDPTNNLLIIPIDQEGGSISWYIDGNAQPPYDISVEVHLNGQVIISVSRSLGRRSPDFIPVEGGESRGFNQRVKVNFPTGALPEAADVRVEAPVNGENSLGGKLMELTAIGRVSGQEITQFSQPVTITVEYTDEEAARLLEHAGMKDESSLTLFYFDEAENTWRPLDTTVDPEANLLTALSDHFTLFDYKVQNWEAARLPSLASFQVSGFTGAATYSYPIQVPPGPGGLQPSLSLSYNSQVVDSATSRSQASWVGMGWSLDTGYIQRNMNGTPNYTGDDTFNLIMNGVGGLLLPIPDQDGDSTTIDYHFAEERFWRVRQYLATGNVSGYPGDVGYWVVWAPDGTQYYFGNYYGGATDGHAWYPSYPTTCASITMETWRWSMTRVRNIFGKELTYNYTNEGAPSPKYDEGCSGYRANMAVAVYPESIIYPTSRYRVVFVREAGTRTDYDTAWNDAQSTMLYMRSKLVRIEIWQDPNGTWSSGDEVMIRKYLLGYGESGQQIFPNLTWPAGGKTPTLTSITEYGLYGTNPLPAVLFYYDATDDMHLDYSKNGNGGKVDFNYSEWNANDGLEFFVGGSWTYSTGEYYPDAITPYGDDLDWLKELFQPGGTYKIVARVWPTQGGSWVKLGLNDGIEHLYSSQTNLTWGQWNTITSYISINGTASQARALFYCNGGCNLDTYKVYPVVTRYRVSSKTLTDEVTNSTYAYQYSYSGAAVNDAATSGYVAGDPGGTHLMTKPYTEFRGHSSVTETGPEGKVVQTLYKQDDIYKGMAWDVIVKNTSGNLYEEHKSEFSFQETTTGTLPHPDGQPADYYHDLEIMWAYTIWEKNYVYNGDASVVVRRDDFLYDTAKQGGSQYGNITHTYSYYWNGSAYVIYRGTLSEYYPQVTNGTPESSRYLVGLPAYNNSYACPGGCDWLGNDLLSSRIYLYDANTDFYFPPTNGIPKGERVFTHWVSSTPYYADTAYVYDAWGNRTTVTQYTGYGASFASGGGAQTTYTCYGGGGTLGGHTCSTNYYRTYPSWEHNALGQMTNFDYDETKSVPSSVTDPNGDITSATYDEFGRITKIIRPGDDSNNPTMSMSYHVATLPFSSNPFWTEAQQRIDGSVYFKVRKYYSGLGQLLQTQVVGATIGANTRDILVDSFYDAGGRVYRQTVPYDVTTGSNYHTRSTTAAYTETIYDILGRPTDISATDGSQTGYTYWDGYSSSIPYTYIEVTDARVNSTTTRSDLWGRVNLVTPPTGPSVTYTYDAADRLLTVGRGGATTTLTYDYASRKLSMADPDMGTWYYAYDAVGNLTRQRDGRGYRICMYYDALNRLTGKHYRTNDSCPTSPTYQVTNTYDQGTNGIGRRTRQDYDLDRNGTMDSYTTWSYDDRGRVVTELRTLTGGTSFQTQWTYNSADLVKSMTYPANASGGAGEVVNFAYLPQMLLDTVIGTNTYVKNTDYDAAGRVEVRDLGLSGSNPVIKVDYSYFDWTTANGQGRLSKIMSGIVSDLDSLQDLRYTYDANGNVLTIQDWKAGGTQTQTFTYDTLDRLSSAVASGGTGGTYSSQSYTYNSTTGNLASKAGVSYTYGDTNHKHAVTAMGSNTFGYDANGNQTSRTVSGSSYTLTYDQENHLVTVSGAATATFYYDGDGNRVKATIGGTTTTYIGNHFEWLSSTSNMKKYYYAGNTRVVMRYSSSMIYYLLEDHLGSTTISTNSSGVKTAEKRYYPWGTERYTDGAAVTTYRFTGQRYETGIGLYFYNARWYDPALARFISADTLIPNPSDSQSFDRYSYTNNNPVNYTDDSGHFAWFVSGAIGTAIGGIVGGVVYSVCNRDNFTSGGLLTAIGAGAVAGGLIGSGVGLLAAPATSAALATAATAMVGAGTGAAGSGVGYTVTNQNLFDTTAFVETTAIGGSVGGISSITPLSPLGVAAKATTYIAGSETLYALQTDNWTVEGARNAAIYGGIGAGFDVTFTGAVANTSSILKNYYPTSGPQGYIPQPSTSDILTSAARLRAGMGMLNYSSGLISGTGASISNALINKYVHHQRH